MTRLPGVWSVIRSTVARFAGAWNVTSIQDSAKLAAIGLFVLALVPLACLGQEHLGKEHLGKEHLGKEHLGKEQWPQFRGPSGNGLTSANRLPTRWSEADSGRSKNIAWKTAIHDKGWSSPVVWDNQIWLTTARTDGTKLFAICVDYETGRIQHDLTVFDIENPQYCIEKNSYASSTPVIEEGRVYLHFGAHGTACLDTKSGSVIWARQDLPCYHHRGPASSPILHGNLLILTFDGFDQQYLVALDKRTGATVWKKDRDIQYETDNGDLKKAYGTPHIIEVRGIPLLISPSASATIAYDARTGQEIWRVRCGGFNVSARPVFGDGQVFVNTEGGFRMFGVRPDGQGDVTTTHVTWQFAKGVPKHSSILVSGKLIFMGTDQGVVTCLQTATGDVVYQQRVGGVFTASPILDANDQAYFFSEDGTTTVFKAAEKFQLVSTNKLPEGFMASPAVKNNSLILRTITDLYRIDE